MGNPFTDHPRRVGETYAEHLLQAAGFGRDLILAGAACLVHALFPFVCTHTGSDAVARLHGVLSARGARAAEPEVPPEDRRRDPGGRAATRFVFDLEVADAPGALARVLNPFWVAQAVLERASYRRRGPLAAVRIEASNLTLRRARILERRLAGCPLVRRARLAERKAGSA